MQVPVYRLPCSLKTAAPASPKRRPAFVSIGLQYPYSGGNKVVFAHLNILHETMAISFAVCAEAGRLAEFRKQRIEGWEG